VLPNKKFASYLSSLIFDFMRGVLIFILLLLAACETREAYELDLMLSKRELYKRRFTPMSGDYDSFEYRQYKQFNKYPTYDPSADNPPPFYEQPTIRNGYPEHYPKYDREADNPYYPPSDYDPFYGEKRYYKYPKFNPEADNPYYPAPDDNMFDEPMFRTPMFES
jgi:hypothetical protein